MLIFVAMLFSLGLYLALGKPLANKIIGYTFIGYATNLYILSCVRGKSPLMQSIVITSIVIGIAIMYAIIKRYK